MNHIQKAALALLVFLPLAVLYNSFVFMKIWNWHVVELFLSQPITYLVAMGATVAYGFVLSGLYSAVSKSVENTEVHLIAIQGFSSSSFYLLIAYIVEVIKPVT